MDHIFVSNITEKDVKSSKIRITVESKFLFRLERVGRTEVYPILVEYNNEWFEANYSIGSRDEKSRSGLLNLGSHLYKQVLKINSKTKLKITRLDSNKYRIEKF